MFWNRIHQIADVAEVSQPGNRQLEKSAIATEEHMALNVVSSLQYGDLASYIAQTALPFTCRHER
jgi:hypothetical protein